MMFPEANSYNIDFAKYSVSAVMVVNGYGHKGQFDSVIHSRGPSQAFHADKYACMCVIKDGELWTEISYCRTKEWFGFFPQLE